MSTPDTILEVEGLTLRAMSDSRGRYPAKEWCEGLTKRGKAQLLSRLEQMAVSIRLGRPLILASRMAESQAGLWEMRITHPGGTPPHLRLFFIRKGNTLWAAGGISKQKNKIKKQDWNRAENTALHWLVA